VAIGWDNTISVSAFNGEPYRDKTDIKEKLGKRREDLERQLLEVIKALEALEKYPEVQQLVNFIRKEG